MMMLMVFLRFHTTSAQTLPDDTAGRRNGGIIHRVGDSVMAFLTKPLQPKPLSWKAIVIPGALIAYGTLSVTSDELNRINLTGRRWAAPNEDPNRKTSIDDYTQVIPAIAVYGLHIAGIRGKNNIIDATLMYCMSLGIANAVVMPVKHWTAHRRPDSSDDLSFPSGHTATAFVSAEFLRQEYKDLSPWIGAGGYACAILTGYLRMYNNKHWFSDVAAGAGIGILSTRVTYWLYPKMKNFILGKTPSTSTMLWPTYGDGRVGICMLHAF